VPRPGHRLERKPDQTAQAVQPKNRKLRHQEVFLRAYEESCCITWAAHAARITRKTHYQWLRQDPAYVRAFDESRILAADFLESCAVQRATAGWLEPVRYRGEQCGTVRRYDNGLLMFLLRGMWPEKYGNRPVISTHVSARVQPSVTVTVSHRDASAEAEAKDPLLEIQARPATAHPGPKAAVPVNGNGNGHRTVPQSLQPVPDDPDVSELARKLLICRNGIEPDASEVRALAQTIRKVVSSSHSGYSTVGTAPRIDVAAKPVMRSAALSCWS
jgi:hypothetical protein